MGIRFHCDHCGKRLNVKAAQAGEFCICPDCESEIQIPLESTIEPKKKLKKRRRRKRPVEVDVSPVVTEVVPNEFATGELHSASVASVVVPVEESSGELQVEEVSVTDVQPEVNAAVLPEVAEVAPVEAQDAPLETEVEAELEQPASEPATFGDDEKVDSAEALDQLLGVGDELETENPFEETESFLLAKPVAKIGEDPLKGNPDLVWYLRHKRLGEKGPLKAREIEAMLEAGQIRRGYIVWREDWNDWLPAEKIFPELAEKKAAESTYEIPDDLNPHSEVNRKRRARKRFWLCFSAVAFLLLLVLVYWMTQFGS